METSQICLNDSDSQTRVGHTETSRLHGYKLNSQQRVNYTETSQIHENVPDFSKPFIRTSESASWKWARFMETSRIPKNELDSWKCSF